MTSPTQPISRPAYLALALAIACVGAGVTIGTSLAFGGTSETALWAAASLGIASLAGLAPAFLPYKPESWGTVVFGASAARMLLVLAVGYPINAGHQFDARAYWMSLLAGAVFVLIAETAMAISTLSRIERARAGQSSPNSTASIAGTERSKA